MWLFTRDGFYSAVQYDPSKDKEPKSIFKKIAQNKHSHILVRGRVKRDLEALRKVVPNVKIVDDVVADYKYRAVITRRQWKKFQSLATDDIDYDSHFKEVMRDGDPVQPTARYSAVSSVWSAMITLQPYKPWSSPGKGGKGSKSKVSTGSSVQSWLGEREDEGFADLAGILNDQDFVKKDYSEDGPLSIDDVKAYVLGDVTEKKYTNFLTDEEIARCDTTAFAFWVKLKEEVAKIGRANLHIDEHYLDELEDEVLDDLFTTREAEATAPPETEKGRPQDVVPVAPPENVTPLVPPEKLT